jgi:hypothetical protein
MTSNEKFNWCDYYELANSYSNEKDEAKLRTGISRFYNSSFCISRNFLLQNKIYLDKNSKNLMNSKSSKVHSETRRIFEKHPMLNFSKNGEKNS